MKDDLDDLGIVIISEECELIENTILIMKHIWIGVILSGCIIYALNSDYACVATHALYHSFAISL
jgi:hypothetical protein